MNAHPTFLVESESITKNEGLAFPPLHEFKIRWKVLFSLVALHLASVAAVFFITPAAIFLAVGLWVVVGLLGITVGYHRLCTHQSFSTYNWVKYIHLAVASISLQQGPISWSRIHRRHHQKSDSIQDPHPQIYGFWYGHCGWTFLSHPQLGRPAGLEITPRELRNDKVILFLERNHYWFFLAHCIGLYALGGFPFLLWGAGVRTTLSLHAAWFVNSLGHRFGYRNYPTRDESKNNPFVALLTFGEGWHNNHHKFPFSPRHGLRWFEIDLSWYWIKFLSKLGLAWDLQLPTKSQT